MAGKAKTKFAGLERILLTWPGVERSTSYGKPSLKVAGKFLTRLKEDGDSLVIGGVGFDERETLIETQGDVFYITDHYRNYQYVLMRLSKADPAQAEAFMRRRWRELAPKKLLAVSEPRSTPSGPVQTAKVRGRKKTTATK